MGHWMKQLLSCCDIIRQGSKLSPQDDGKGAQNLSIVCKLVGIVVLNDIGGGVIVALIKRERSNLKVMIRKYRVYALFKPLVNNSQSVKVQKR